MAESIRTTLSPLEFRVIVPLVGEVSRRLLSEGQDDHAFSGVRVIDPIVYSGRSDRAVIIPDIYYVQSSTNGIGKEYIAAVQEAAVAYTAARQQSLNESSPYITDDQAENEAQECARVLTAEFIGRRIAGQTS